MVVVTQALVAIGGRARRLPDVDVRISKSFLPGLEGQPFLYWSLRSLEMAGIRRVLLAAHTSEQHHQARDVLGGRRWAFDDVDFFRDGGLGVHGIPYQARELLDANFLFEAGHGVCAPEHYVVLAERKTRGNVVFSAFVPRADNPRFLTGIGAGGRCRDAGEPWALAHPMVIDREYAERLPAHGFDVNRAAAAYRDAGRLLAVPAPTPVEFDVVREYRRTLNVHRVNASECANGLPWRHAPAADAVELTREHRDSVVLG